MTPEIQSLITDLYRGFLSREPEQGGFDYWTNRLDAACKVGRGKVREEIHTIVSLFEGSQEFDNRVTAIVNSAPADPVIVVPTADVDVRGNPVPAPSGPPGATMGEQPGQPPYPGMGGGPCGSYQVAGGWLYILEDMLAGRFGNSIRIAIPRDQAVAFRFFTGDFKDRPLVIASEENTVRGPLAARFVTLSEKRFDFDYAKQGNHPGYVLMHGGGAIQAVFDPSSTWAGRMSLKPNTHYYLNIKCDDPNLASATMGTTIGFS